MHKLQVKMNTGLPVSAAVEHFVGLVSTHLRLSLKPS